MRGRRLEREAYFGSRYREAYDCLLQLANEAATSHSTHKNYLIPKVALGTECIEALLQEYQSLLGIRS
jgi:hypothetical protein